MASETQRLVGAEREALLRKSLPSGGRVFLKLFLHSLAMFTLPFYAYFTFRDYVEAKFGVEQPQSYIYGAVAAVCVIQAVIFSYLYQAFREEQQERKLRAETKKD